MSAFVYAYYVGDTVTQRLTTGCLIFLNGALIYWYSKKQTSIGTSIFGDKFIAI